MSKGATIAAMGFVVLLAASGCAAPSGPAGQAGPEGGERGGGAPRRITTVIRGNPFVLAHKLNVGNNFIGTSQLERMVNAGLVISDREGALHAQLAEDVPTIQNGLWKVFPDGRMETTWKLRPNTRWHDGVPLTAEDVVFAARVEQDRELEWSRNIAYDAVESVEAPDPMTVTVTWKRSYVEADIMFSTGGSRALPLPRHLLEQSYTESRATFLQLPYWSAEFVGAGSFRLREWVPDSHLVLTAFDAYLLGRPKIDEIEVRLVPDTNTVMANILAGAVDYTMDGRSLPFEEARHVGAQWGGGRMELGPGGTVTIFPQFLNSNPPVVADVRFRRALMHAMDRQEIVDTIQGGLADVAHSGIGPGQIEYAALERNLVRYEFDPRKAMQMLADLGYIQGPDGVLRDAQGRPLSFNLHTTITTINQKATQAVADSWRKLGMEVETPTIPLQLQFDRQFMFTLPAFHLLRIGRNLTFFQSLHSREIAVPENNFAGNNRGRYSDPEFDALIDRYFVTIPLAERMEVAGRIVRHETDQLVLMRVVFDPEATMVSNRLKNVTAGAIWNPQLWEVQ
jgi:peptide/nickel transport system substrate-binding protein